MNCLRGSSLLIPRLHVTPPAAGGPLLVMKLTILRRSGILGKNCIMQVENPTSAPAFVLIKVPNETVTFLIEHFPP